MIAMSHGDAEGVAQQKAAMLASDMSCTTAIIGYGQQALQQLNHVTRKYGNS